MKKGVSKKEGLGKSLKKVKSFNIDDKIYKNLVELFEESGTQISLSVLVDEFLRKLYVYVIEADGVIKRQKSDLPLSQIVYDCRQIEYFREANKKDIRVLNLIWSHEASQRGMSLDEYLHEYVSKD